MWNCTYIQRGLYAEEQIGRQDLLRGGLKYTTQLWSILYEDLLDSCSYVLDKIIVKFYFNDFVILQTQNF